jgi:histidine ammonia-lyase
MGSVAALKLLPVFENVETVLAIEMLTASQALDYRLPLRPGGGVEAAHKCIRGRAPHREADYLFRDDLAPILDLVQGTRLLEAVKGSGVAIQ